MGRSELSGLSPANGLTSMKRPSLMRVMDVRIWAEMIDIDPEEVEEWRQTVSRNAECPCGSGRKFKHCHGRLV